MRGHHPQGILTLGQLSHFVSVYVYSQTHHNGGKTPKFFCLVAPQRFFINTTGHKWKAQQFFTRHDNREDNIKLSVTTN